jgi:hypothetical protein
MSLVRFFPPHFFYEGDAAELESRIDAHLEKFDDVDEYDGLDRPKHHFQKHLPSALQRFGPFRAFWCMPWEAFVQVRPLSLLLARMFTLPPSAKAFVDAGGCSSITSLLTSLLVPLSPTPSLRLF